MEFNLHPDEPAMSQEQTRALFEEVQHRMAAHVVPSLTEVYFPGSPGEPFENGTGAFVAVDEAKLLVSNDHVIRNAGLVHSFQGSDRFFAAAQRRYGVEYPVDVGAAQIDPQVWAGDGGGAQAIAFARFAERHETVPYEILWMGGFPGARVKQLHEVKFAVCEATPTQEYLFHEGTGAHESFDPHFHFAVYYSPGNAIRIESAPSSPGRSVPPGLSGTLVWNTRRLERHYAGAPWTPDLAVVTGIVWGWPGANYLIATRVQHFRQFLLQAAAAPRSA